jgi:CHASE2 domain-containing sensor protein
VLGSGAASLASSDSSLPGRGPRDHGHLARRYGTHVFRELDLGTVDWRFSIHGKTEPAGFAVVAIDDVTFGDLKVYPLPRRFHARVIDRLKADGAKLIAYDIQFSEPAPDPVDDNALLDAARAARNVVFATTEVSEKGEPNFVGVAEGSIPYARPRWATGTSTMTRAGSSAASPTGSTD